jgi:hypothetical protein
MALVITGSILLPTLGFANPYRLSNHKRRAKAFKTTIRCRTFIVSKQVMQVTVWRLWEVAFAYISPLIAETI